MQITNAQATEMLAREWNMALALAEDICTLSADAIRLAAGELTAAEMRAVKAVLSSRAAKIRSMRRAVESGVARHE